MRFFFIKIRLQCFDISLTLYFNLDIALEILLDVVLGSCFEIEDLKTNNHAFSFARAIISSLCYDTYSLYINTSLWCLSLSSCKAMNSKYSICWVLGIFIFFFKFWISLSLSLRIPLTGLEIDGSNPKYKIFCCNSLICIFQALFSIFSYINLFWTFAKFSWSFVILTTDWIKLEYMISHICLWSLILLEMFTWSNLILTEDGL